VYVVKVTHISL